MTMSSLHARRLIATGFLFAAVGMLACEGDAPTSPDGLQIRAAKPPKDGGGDDPTVTSADPSSGEQGAVGLQITIEGKGFEKGAKVAFHLSPEADPDVGMTVQSTEFVNETKLIATTDIALDAEVAARYISVSFRGRRGIGTEKLFEVKENSGIGQLEGTPLRARSLTGVMTDDVDEFGDYEDGVDDMAVHLSGVNGNLMFRTADPPTLREVFVTVDGIAGDGYTRTFTNETTVDGVLRADGLRDLPPDGGQEIRTKLDSQFRDVAGKSYLLRYGRDCFGMFNNDDLDVTFASSTWTLEGSNAVLCERVKKGKNKLVPVGGDGGAVGAPLTIVLIKQ